MNPAELPVSRAFALRPWFIWFICVVAVVQAWAFVDNVIDHEWVLAICFGSGTVASVVQAVVLIWLRRRTPGDHRLFGRDTAVSDDVEWVASIPLSSGGSIAGRFSMLGGTLALTDEAVTFTPLAGLGRVRRFALIDIRNVEAVADRPPRLRLTTIQGRSLVLMVFPHRYTAVWSRDSGARDQAIAAITDRLTHG